MLAWCVLARRSLVEITTAWLDLPIFDIGMDKGVNKIWGAGEFTVQSYYIFGKDDRDIAPTDKALQSYVRWRDHSHSRDVE